MGVVRNKLVCLFFAVATSIGAHAYAQEAAQQDEPNGADQTSGESLLLVIGAEGDDTFGNDFRSAAAKWQLLAKQRGWSTILVDKKQSDASPKELMRTAIEAWGKEPPKRSWIVMLGHGTFTNGVAKFNLDGPDITPKEMGEWLKPIQSPVVIVNCASASAPFLSELASTDRIVVTATKSGSEYNYARFGKFLAQAIMDPQFDLDHDYEVSLLEAFLAGSNMTNRFYEEESRLTTEHALLNDNGDRIGTTADFYRGVRPVKAAKDGAIDGGTAAYVILYSSPDVRPLTPALVEKRDKLEAQLEELRAKKSLWQEDQYYAWLEEIMLQLAEVYDEVESASTTPSAESQAK